MNETCQETRGGRKRKGGARGAHRHLVVIVQPVPDEDLRLGFRMRTCVVRHAHAGSTLAQPHHGACVLPDKRRQRASPRMQAPHVQLQHLRAGWLHAPTCGHRPESSQGLQRPTCSSRCGTAATARRCLQRGWGGGVGAVAAGGARGPRGRCTARAKRECTVGTWVGATVGRE